MGLVRASSYFVGGDDCIEHDHHYSELLNVKASITWNSRYEISQYVVDIARFKGS